jgi:hypothetical protein
LVQKVRSGACSGLRRALLCINNDPVSEMRR